jgi:hydrogenase nickel incorporation protein HypA/HybF
MHELSVSSAIVETVERHAAGRKVTCVSLRLGKLRQVVPDTLAFYWGFVTQGTVCEGARLEQEIVEARLRCEACDVEWSLDEPDFRCPRCASAAVEIVSGNELEVESIEVEEAACTASG